MNNNAPVSGRTSLCAIIAVVAATVSCLGTLVSAPPIPGDSNMSGQLSKGNLTSSLLSTIPNGILTSPDIGSSDEVWPHIAFWLLFVVLVSLLLCHAYDDRIKSCVRKCLEKGPVTTNAIEMVSLTGNGQNVAEDGGEGPSGVMNTQPTPGLREGTGEEKGPDNSNDPTSEHKKSTRKTKHLD